MIKVTVLYPNTEGKKFDMDYYVNTHIPLVRRLLGAACTHAEVDAGIGGGLPGSPAPYFAIGHLHFNTLEDYITSFTPNAAAIIGDIPNYTNSEPVVQVNEVKM